MCLLGDNVAATMHSGLPVLKYSVTLIPAGYLQKPVAHYSQAPASLFLQAEKSSNPPYADALRSHASKYGSLHLYNYAFGV